MLNLLRKLPGLKFKGPLQTISFFALFYLYLWLMVKPHLIYHGGGLIMNFPAFFRDGEFFREFLSYPGGLVEYLSAFLAQLFYYSWAGALVITLQAWLICACVDYFLKTINSHHFRWLGFIPAVLLLIIYNQYTYHLHMSWACSCSM